MNENTNNACYAEELEYCIQLITALEYLVSVIENKPARYPSLMADVTCLLYGRKCYMTSGNAVMVNGLHQQIEELYSTMEQLGLEVDLEVSDANEAPLLPPSEEIPGQELP